MEEKKETQKKKQAPKRAGVTKEGARVRRNKVSVVRNINAAGQIIPEPSNAMCRTLTIENHFVSNTVVTCLLDVYHIDLKRIARDQLGTIFHRERFSAFRMNLRHPRSTGMFYPLGEEVCMAAKTNEESLLACQMYVHLLNQFGVPCAIKTFSCNNVVSTTLSFPLDVEEISSRWNNATLLGPTFPAVRIRCNMFGLDTNITATCFATGKINLTGAKTFQEANNVLKWLYSNILQHVRVRGDAPAPSPVSKNVENDGSDVDEDDSDDEEDVFADDPMMRMMEVVAGFDHPDFDEDSDDSDSDDDDDDNIPSAQAHKAGEMPDLSVLAAKVDF